MGQPVQRLQKMTFFKSKPGPHAVAKQVFLACFKLVVACFGPRRIPICPENGLFWDKKWVKNGRKMYFSKQHLQKFGVQNKWNEPLLTPLQSILAPL